MLYLKSQPVTLPYGVFCEVFLKNTNQITSLAYMKTFQCLLLSLREHLKSLKPQDFVIIYGIGNTWSQPFYLKIERLLFLADISPSKSRGSRAE